MRQKIAALGLMLLFFGSASDAARNPAISPAPQDDGIFSNPIAQAGEDADHLDHGSLGVRLSFMLRRFATNFRRADGAPGRIINDSTAFDALPGNHAVTWIGHSTMLLQMDGAVFLTDPIWSKVPSPIPPIGPRRFVPPGIALEDLPVIDFVVISHNHYDHLDLPTLRDLAERSPQTLFLVPLGNAALLRKAGVTNVRELDWGQSVEVAGVTVHCLPAQHWSKRSLTDSNKSLWSSWAVIGPERRFYHAGDTGYFSGFAAIGQHLGPFDLAAVPIGAYAPRAMMRASHMNPEEAVTAALDVKAQAAVAMHFGTFDLSDEPLSQPPLRFVEAAIGQGLGKQRAWVLKIGESRQF